MIGLLKDLGTAGLRCVGVMLNKVLPWVGLLILLGMFFPSGPGVVLVTAAAATLAFLILVGLMHRE